MGKATRVILFLAVMIPLALHSGFAAAAAHCFCRLQCNTNVLQQFTDPAGLAYTQIGNTQIKACNRYCAGWFDGTNQAGGFSTYLTNWQQHMQCVGVNTAAQTCSMTLNIRDSVGTASYYQANVKTFTATLSVTCPAGQQVSFDSAKCGTATTMTLSGAADQYIQPNWFTHGGTIYNITGNANKACTGWH